MDFVKLKELPRVTATIQDDVDTKKFKAYKKRVEESCGIQSDVSAMSFCPVSESSQLALACGSKVEILDVGFATTSEYASWSKHKNLVHCIAYRKDGKLLVAGDGDGAANIYDVAVSKTIIRRLRGHDGAIQAVTFCHDKSRVATGGKDQAVKIWDVPTGQVIQNLKGHSDSVRVLLAIGEQGLVSAGADGKIIQWDLRDQGQALAVVEHGHPVEKLAMFDSGAMFFSIGGGAARLWDVRTMKEVKEAASLKHTKPVTSAIVSECGDFVATSSYDMTVKITRIATWEVVASFTSPVPVTAMAWRGESLVYGCENGSWIIRQKRLEESAPVTTEATWVLPDEARYYRTNVVANADGSRPKTGKESTADYLLRKFEYRKLVDFLVDSAVQTPLAMAITDELIQRGGLVAALRDRPTEELVKVVEWCSRNIVADPRCSIGLVAQVIDLVVQGNARAFACPQGEAGTKLVNAVKVLNGKISQEMTLQYKASSLAGLIESLMVS